MLTLYSDDHPEKSLKNTGFKNKTMAKQTLSLIKKRSLHYQFSVVNTMYYRAKNHPNKTKQMEEAMQIFKQWIDKYPEKKKKDKNIQLTLDKIKMIEKRLDINTINLIKKNKNTLWKLKFIVYPGNSLYDLYSYIQYIIKKSK
jgi:hypothetical protein